MHGRIFSVVRWTNQAPKGLCTTTTGSGWFPRRNGRRPGTGGTPRRTCAGSTACGRCPGWACPWRGGRRAAERGRGPRLPARPADRAARRRKAEAVRPEESAQRLRGCSPGRPRRPCRLFPRHPEADARRRPPVPVGRSARGDHRTGHPVAHLHRRSGAPCRGVTRCTLKPSSWLRWVAPTRVRPALPGGVGVVAGFLLLSPVGSACGGTKGCWDLAVPAPTGRDVLAGAGPVAAAGGLFALRRRDMPLGSPRNATTAEVPGANTARRDRCTLSHTCPAPRIAWQPRESNPARLVKAALLTGPDPSAGDGCRLFQR